MVSMDLELIVKYLKKKNNELRQGILGSSKEHPIVYLDNEDFKRLDEYKVLEFLAEKNYLYKNDDKGLIYFSLTPLGKERLFGEHKS